MNTITLQRYGSVLEDHLHDEGGEVALLRAYELGRELIQAEAGILDVIRLHRDALVDLDVQAGRQRKRADAFLAEVLAPFEMAYLGFQEANTSLRGLAATLETQVQNRTRELQESLSALQVADADRRRLLARLVSAQEAERQRIANDLHDDPIQVMTAVGLRLGVLRRQLPAEDMPPLEGLEHAISDTIGRLRRLMFELRPPALDNEGLAAAIGVYLRMALESLDCTVHDLLDAQPPVHVRETAYRIIQEALANIRKHAHATRVTITLEDRRGGLRVSVVDDGAGFDTRLLDRPRPGHMGTSSMRERATLAGGSCEIDSTPGEGTTVTLWLPHDAPQL